LRDHVGVIGHRAAIFEPRDPRCRTTGSAAV